MIDINKKYAPITQTDSRYFIITGGRGSGKSFSINLLLVLLTYEKGHTILFTRYTLASAYVSIIPEFIDKLELLNIFDDFYITKDEIKNKRSGSKIIFKGIKTSSGDQTANLKSLQGVTTFVLDEAEELTSEDTFDKIDLSVRQQGSHNRVILILNPTSKEHWIYRRYFEDKGIQEGSNTTKDNITYIHTTYIDNKENLSQSYLQQIENIKKRRPEKYKHQMLGGWLSAAEGVIFTNWTIGDFNSNEEYIFGQDFGFSVDPSALVEVAIDKSRKIIWLKEHFYKTGLTTSQIFDLAIRYCGKNLIVADNSEPRLLTELKVKGLNIVPTIKKKGSILTGITLMQDYNIIIDNSSINLIREFNNYAWKLTNSIPQDKFNHAIDGARYSCQYLLTRSVPHGSYFVK